MEKKLLIIIPAYNEEGNIERVIECLKNKYSYFDYVVVNDGSKDKTAQICQENGYHMIDLPVNLGLAGAFQTGVRYAYEKGYEYVLQFDGDGQHKPEYIDGMLELAEREKCDIVIGSRYAERKKPFSLRMLGSRLISGLIRMTTGYKIKDPTSGMRLCSRAVMKRMAYETNMGPEPDTVSYLIKCGASVKEYQVDMAERENGESYLNISNSIKYMWHICFSILFLQNFRERKLIRCQ